jgi:hypothetical protein
MFKKSRGEKGHRSSRVHGKSTDDGHPRDAMPDEDVELGCVTGHARFTLPATILVPVMVLICTATPLFVRPLAATPPPPVTINDVFDPDLADVKPAAVQGIKDAAAKAKASEDGCYPPPVASFTAQVKSSGDGSFDASLGQARAGALQQTLTSLGYGEGRVKTGHATGSSDSVQVNYDAPNKGKDTDPPRLKVTWTPPKDTKVKAGDKIRVTIIASERYADGHKSWPTGVQSIQLTANDGLVDSKDYGKPPQPCVRQTLEASYTVPNNPPPIIHLHAIAEDGVGNHGGEDGDFPTGDKWEGTWHVTGIHDSQRYGAGGKLVRHQETFDATFVFYVSGDGVISGEGRATVDNPPGVADECTNTWSPPHFDVPVHITGKSSATVDGQPLFTLELKPDAVPVTFTSKCPKGVGTAPCNWPACAESQCGWRVTMLAKDPSTKDEETLHACGPNNMTQVKVTIHRAHP